MLYQLASRCFLVLFAILVLGVTFATQAKATSIIPDDPSCTPAGVCTNDWVLAPVAFTGAPVTVAGVTSLTSSWTGGRYTDRNGVMQTANVTLTSSFSFAGQLLTLTWKLTNNGSGDFFQYFQAGPGQGPRFLFPDGVVNGGPAPPPLAATQSLTDALTCVCTVVQGTWGGAWNSGVGATDSLADEFQATPEPATWGLVGLSLLGLAKLRFGHR
jgi:hypothetical protein